MAKRKNVLTNVNLFLSKKRITFFQIVIFKLFYNFFSMTKTDFRIRTKLTKYRFERSGEKLQINLAVYPDKKKIKITLCFSSENYEFASQEKEFIKDLLEEDLLPDSWYLVLHYKFIEVEVPYFKQNNIINFVLIR